MSKKLLVSIGTLSAGGAERVLSILSKVFADSFDEVLYVLWYDMPMHYQIDERVKIVILPCLSATESRIRNMFVLRKLVLLENPTLILSFLTPFNMLVLSALVGISVKVIVCERNDPHNIKGKRIMEVIRNLLYRRADACLVQTHYGRECYPSYIRKKMSVIYNPIIMPQDMIGKAVLAEKEDLFVSVGRLHPQKNQKMMISDMERFNQIYPSYKLIIYGEGECRTELEEYIRKKGLLNIVFLLGESKSIWDKLLSAKAFLLSSNYEGMSNALIEAMCLGLPVISTKVSGSTDLIQDGENGFLVDIQDEKAMLEKMLLLANNANKAKWIGENASQLYQILNYDIISKQWIEHLGKIIIL